MLKGRLFSKLTHLYALGSNLITSALLVGMCFVYMMRQNSYLTDTVWTSGVSDRVTLDRVTRS